ncbi:MAG TPA: hypothetical protein VGO59_04270 [Verrucomicrobiae bacterium]|jgi:hypothetical protein
MITQKMNRALSNLVVAVWLVAGAGAEARNLIQNGSFEAPVEPGAGVYVYVAPSPLNSPTGWTGGADIFQVPAGAAPFSFAGLEWPAAEDGIQYDDIGTDLYAAALTQVVNVPRAGLYTLTWFDNDAYGFAYNYQVLLNGNIEATPNGVGGPDWTPRSLALTLNAGNNTLAFLGQPQYDTLLDNVGLQPAQAVPDVGGTFFLLEMAVLGVATFRRCLS